MGFFDSLKKVFQGDSADTSKQHSIHCDELIRFISFAQKTKPLMGGNYGIKVIYSAPNRNCNEYTSPIVAEFGFYDFEDIQFARDFALSGNISMIKFYYNDICEKACLQQADWPYGMDEYDFGRMLTNSDTTGFTALIPDHSNDDIFTMRIKAGLSSDNGLLACRLVEKELSRRFPSINVTRNHATATSFMLIIRI